MKYFKRLKVYKAINVTFNPETQEAYSYGWWRFTARIKGKLVFNDYRYSPTTGNHQSKIRRLMEDELSLKIDYFIEIPGGLQCLSTGINHYQSRIDELELTINKPRSHKAKNNERRIEIGEHLKKIKLIKRLGA